MQQFNMAGCFGALNQFAVSLEAHARHLMQVAFNGSSMGSEEAASMDSEASMQLYQAARSFREIARPLQAAESMDLGIDAFPAREAGRLAVEVRQILKFEDGQTPDPEINDPDYVKHGIALLRNLDQIATSE